MDLALCNISDKGGGRLLPALTPTCCRMGWGLEGDGAHPVNLQLLPFQDLLPPPPLPWPPMTGISSPKTALPQSIDGELPTHTQDTFSHLHNSKPPIY